MRAEIISVGTELLLGDIIDTDAAFLSRKLAELGIGVYRRTTVGDNMERLTQAFSRAFDNAELVIAAGGLGPTADDITKEAAAAYFGMGLVMDAGILSGLEQYFTGRGHTMTENNKKQALIPDGAEAIPNANGTAPGILIKRDDKTLILLPGPPAELEPMFMERVYPLLRGMRGGVLKSRTLRMVGIGESAMETLVRDMMDSKNPTLAPYAGNSETRLRVTAMAQDDAEAETLIAPFVNELYRRLPEYIYGEDGDSLESVVAAAVKKRGLKLACAESCTGGALSARLTGVAGISDVLLESMLTYSNDSKISRLNVRAQTLLAHGAVSPETAMEMAEGAAKTSGADIAISTTGIAGPGGGSADKPVGLVYFGLYADGTARWFKTQSSGNRERIRTRAVVKALEILWRYLEQK